jgi:glycosyltransferase involved in cell wall biosynthesis
MTGVQRSAYEIVSRLLRSDEERYRLFSPKVKGPYAPLLPVEQRGRIRRGHLWEQFELPRLIRAVGKDAVLYSPATSGPLAVTRQVLTIHDLFPVEHPEWFSRPFSAWYRWLLPRLVRKVAYILTNSQYTRQRVLDRFDLDEDKVVLCHFAQNERFVPASDEDLVQLRIDHGLPERYLLAVGTVEPRKNFATLVAAWRLTSARKQGIKLVVAGGAAREAVFNASSSGADALEDPTIRQLGFFPDEHLPLLYQGAEAFVFPSLAEGFGLPVLEAMACGTPVICSNTTALPEISGGAAYLVAPLEIDAWAEAIDSILFDSEIRQRMRSEGIRQAERFSWSHTTKIVRSTLEAVREVRPA